MVKVFNKNTVKRYHNTLSAILGSDSFEPPLCSLHKLLVFLNNSVSSYSVRLHTSVLLLC